MHTIRLLLVIAGLSACSLYSATQMPKETRTPYELQLHYKKGFPGILNSNATYDCADLEPRKKEYILERCKILNITFNGLYIKKMHDAYKFYVAKIIPDTCSLISAARPLLFVHNSFFELTQEEQNFVLLREFYCWNDGLAGKRVAWQWGVAGVALPSVSGVIGVCCASREAVLVLYGSFMGLFIITALGINWMSKKDRDYAYAADEYAAQRLGSVNGGVSLYQRLTNAEIPTINLYEWVPKAGMREEHLKQIMIQPH
jgi:hypothetical protein